MKIITHSSLEEINQAAKENGKEVFETKYSYSFRTFDEKGNTIEYHEFKKVEKRYKHQYWQDPNDLGGTGHGDISYSDADPGI